MRRSTCSGTKSTYPGTKWTCSGTKYTFANFGKCICVLPYPTLMHKDLHLLLVA